MEKNLKLYTKDLNLFYGSTQALKNVTVDIEKNKVTALIGPSGCGKSTFLKTLNRMNDLVHNVRITGKVYLDGLNVYEEFDVVDLRKKVGMVFQKPNPFPISIYENIAYGPKIHGIKSKSRLDEIVEKSLIGSALWDEVKDRLKQNALGLSGGQQQPLAKDLRVISTALKIITDMERIADHSSDIAEITIRMAKDKYIKPLIDVPKMAELAKDMVNKSIDAYLRLDLELALSVCKSDDAVDELFFKIVLELINLMKNDPKSIEQAIDFMFIAKYLERMADHATNIGEWVAFVITGEHEHLSRHMDR